MGISSQLRTEDAARGVHALRFVGNIADDHGETALALVASATTTAAATTVTAATATAATAAAATTLGWDAI